MRSRKPKPKPPEVLSRDAVLSLAGLKGINPTDPTEGMLALQMVACLASHWLRLINLVLRGILGGVKVRSGS